MIDDDHHSFEFKQIDTGVIVNTFDATEPIKTELLKTLEFTEENAIALNKANEHLKKIEKLILDNKVQELELLKKEHDSHIENLKQVLELYLNREGVKITKLESIDDKIAQLNQVIAELQRKNDISDKLLKKFYSEMQLLGNSSVDNITNNNELQFQKEKEEKKKESDELTKMCCQNKKIQELLNELNKKNQEDDNNETYLNFGVEIECQHPSSCCFHDFEEACAYIREESTISELGKEGLRFLEEKRRKALQNEFLNNNLEIKVSQVVSKTYSNCQ